MDKQAGKWVTFLNKQKTKQKHIVIINVKSPIPTLCNIITGNQWRKKYHNFSIPFLPRLFSQVIVTHVLFPPDLQHSWWFGFQKFQCLFDHQGQRAIDVQYKGIEALRRRTPARFC